jgi:DNA segregation ATPase FtsK/SpoIIIE, S-DNA-T family
MDVVVRTPHGDADVTIVSAADVTTLGDVVGYVTGQAVPPVVELDGHPIDASTPVRDAPLVVGSVLATHPPRTDHRGPDDVNLLQLTGPGAGTVRRLELGRYRVGPGRRMSATELGDAVVESPYFELVVEPGAVIVGAIDHAPATVVLAGTPVHEPRQWTGGELVVGGRVFALEVPAPIRTERVVRTVDHDGTSTFSRPPRFDRDDQHLLAVDAVRAATEAAGGLWARRPADPRALEIPFGIVDDQPSGASARVVTVDLDADHAVAVVGTDMFRTPLARTLLIETTTLLGPADLDVVIATGAERLGGWDWAKWLPHSRLDGAPALYSSDTELARWATSFSRDTEPATARWAHPHVTLLVIDDRELWTRRNSPLRQLLAAPPAALRVIALCDSADQAPALCTAVISGAGATSRSGTSRAPGGAGDGTVRLDLLSRSRQVRDIFPALVEPEMAAQVARSLASLSDSELPWRDPSSAGDGSARTLVDVLELTGARPSTIRDRWQAWDRAGANGVRLPIGLTPDGKPMDLAFAPGTNVSISGPTDSDVAAAALSLLHALAATASPRSLPILHLSTTDASMIAEALANLPHGTDRAMATDVGAIDRVLVRLERVLEAGQAVVAVVDALDVAVPQDSLVTRLHEMSKRFPSLRVLTLSMATLDVQAVHMVIDRRAGRLQGVLRTVGPSGNADPMSSAVSFVPFESPTVSTSADLLIRPLVFGRALTPLERRLAVPNNSRRSVELDESMAALVAVIRAAAEEAGVRPPALLPQPLPDVVDLAALLDENPGDAAPFALTDAAGRAELAVAWWQPGASGSLLMLGSPRSGVDVVLSALIVGISERFSPDDLQVYAVDPQPRRLAAIESLPHAGAVASPDRLDDAIAIIEAVAAIVAERRTAVRPLSDHVGIVLFVHDLSQLDRRLAVSNHPGVIDAIRTIAGGGDVRVNIVATATRPADSMGLVAGVADVIVGQMSHAGDYTELGLDEAISSGLGPNRCWSMASRCRMQLAVLTRPLGATIEDRRDEVGNERD